jgi:hypothetical protein
MAYIDARPGWADISLNLETGHVFVQENWHYTWKADAGASAWTLADKRAFHALVDRQIWSVWSSGRFHLRVKGAGRFVKRFPHHLPTTEFDVRWVTSGGHWQVTARKMSPTAMPTRADDSYVVFARREIHLTTKDFAKGRGAMNDAGQTTSSFDVGAHEFGHTNPAGTGPNPDEYVRTSANIGDTASIMNIGKQVRARHLAGLLDSLNKMMPGVTFYV